VALVCADQLYRPASPLLSLPAIIAPALRSCSSPFVFVLTVVSRHVTIAYMHLTGGLIRPHRLPSRIERTLMNVIIQKLNGLWHLIVGSCQIRTPFSETQDRALVIAYARRVYPGAKIFERD
jgi:hypothetical protein